MPSLVQKRREDKQFVEGVLERLSGSQHRLAGRIGISQSLVSSVLRGDTGLSEGTRQLIRRYEVTVLAERALTGGRSLQRCRARSGRDNVALTPEQVLQHLGECPLCLAVATRHARRAS